MLFANKDAFCYFFAFSEARRTSFSERGQIVSEIFLRVSENGFAFICFPTDNESGRTEDQFPIKLAISHTAVGFCHFNFQNLIP
jgi:hypothetical protein